MFDFDDDYDGYNPVEPFSQDEFIVHNDRELRNLDAGRDDWDDGDEDDNDEDVNKEHDFVCPHCRSGTVVRFHANTRSVRCPKCRSEWWL